MFSRADRRIFGWYGDYDGCGYYRIISPLQELAGETARYLMTSEEWETKADRVLPNDWPDYDVVIGQRVCQSDGEGGGPADIWTQRVCRDQSILSVFEVDDDLFSIPQDNPAHEFFDMPTQQNIKACAASSDMVTVSTEPLRDVMLRYNPNVRVIPNYIHSDMLAIPRPDPSDTVTIGWAGSATHKQDFASMGDGLSIAMGLNRNTRFVTIGADYTQGLPMDRVQRVRWFRSTRRAYPHIAKFDIGIAPLEKNSFNESKSYIKALEYAALGIPCVAADFGPYREFVEHGGTGFLAKNPSEWRRYIQDLANHPELRSWMGENARQKAEKFTIQGNIDKWVDALMG